jgi:hypothetical protein
LSNTDTNEEKNAAKNTIKVFQFLSSLPWLKNGAPTTLRIQICSESAKISTGLAKVITNFWLRGFNVSAISRLVSSLYGREVRF